MQQRRTIIDLPSPADELLGPGTITPETFAPLVELMHQWQSAEGPIVVRPDQALNRLLAEYRQQFTQQLARDLAYNVQQLREWAVQLGPAHATLQDPLIGDALTRLEEGRHFLTARDAWAGNELELACWNTHQQFYCDALWLADRLSRYERGDGPRRRGGARVKRRNLAPGCASYSLGQAAMNMLEQALPNGLFLRPMHCVLPTAFYVGAHALTPWRTFRWLAFVEKLRGLITSGALANLVGRPEPVIDIRGLERFLSNETLYDRRCGRTRHNIVLAMSHRHSVIDLPIVGQVLHGIDHAVWANELFFPKSAKRDELTVLVSPGQKRDQDAMLAKSAAALIEQAVPLLIAVDGGGPYLPYGQQMRVKRGIRRLIDYLGQRCKGTTRRTYIVPLSLNDPVTFLQGRDPRITVTFHDPICADNIAGPLDPPDPGQVNWGDPLLNYLEGFFLSNTGQVRHGWRTPQVVQTVRRVADQALGGGVRGWIRQRFHASLYDLSRDQSVAEAERTGP